MHISLLSILYHILLYIYARPPATVPCDSHTSCFIQQQSLTITITQNNILLLVTLSMWLTFLQIQYMMLLAIKLISIKKDTIFVFFILVKHFCLQLLIKENLLKFQKVQPTAHLLLALPLCNYTRLQRAKWSSNMLSRLSESDHEGGIVFSRFMPPVDDVRYNLVELLYQHEFIAFEKQS